jgi:hypothetical protein
MNYNLNDRDTSKLQAFFAESRYLTETQNAAIDNVIPMTQEIFDAIMERYDEVGEPLDTTMIQLFMDHPDLADCHMEKIDEELRRGHQDPPDDEDDE